MDLTHTTTDRRRFADSSISARWSAWRKSATAGSHHGRSAIVQCFAIMTYLPLLGSFEVPMPTRKAVSLRLSHWITFQLH